MGSGPKRFKHPRALEGVDEVEEDDLPAPKPRILVHSGGDSASTQVLLEVGDGQQHTIPVLALRFEAHGRGGKVRLVLEVEPATLLLEVLPEDVVVIEREKGGAKLGEPEIPF